MGGPRIHSTCTCLPIHHPPTTLTIAQDEPGRVGESSLPIGGKKEETVFTAAAKTVSSFFLLACLDTYNSTLQ